MGLLNHGLSTLPIVARYGLQNQTFRQPIHRPNQISELKTSNVLKGGPSIYYPPMVPSKYS
jgi:hypothetical protein